MSTYRLSTDQIPSMDLEIRRLDTKQPITWLRQGYEDLRAQPVASLFYGAVVAAVSLLFVYLTIGVDRFYLVPFLFGGFLIIAPLLSIGLMAIAKRRDQPETQDRRSTLNRLQENRSSIAMMGIFLLLVFVNWIMLSNLMFGGIFQEVLPTYETVRPLPMMFGESLPFLAVYGGLALVLAVIVFRVTAFSLPMLIDQRIDAFNATFASWRAVGENWPAMTLWAAIILGLTTLAFATYLIGLIVVVPWLGYATWHAYRDAFEPQGPRG